MSGPLVWYTSVLGEEDAAGENRREEIVRNGHLVSQSERILPSNQLTRILRGVLAWGVLSYQISMELAGPGQQRNTLQPTGWDWTPDSDSVRWNN